MKKTLIIIVLFLVFCDTINSVEEVKPTTLQETKNYEDTLYVIDNYDYSEKGNLKPSCSSSPDYCKCMNSRIKRLELKIDSLCI